MRQPTGAHAAVEPTSPAPSRPMPQLVFSQEPQPTTSLLLWGVVAAVLLPRLAVLFFNENYFGDAVARTELAWRWAYAPQFEWISSFEDGAYQFGPLHLYLVGLVLKVWPSPEHAGRLVSLVFGVASVIPLFFLTRRYFGERAAVWAGLAFGAWGMHVQMSTTAASEAVGLFFLLAALAAYARGRSGNDVGALVGAAFMLNLACATRYEAWMLMPLLCLLLIAGEEDHIAAFTRAGLFGLACLPFPMVWMQGNEMAHGDPLYPVHFIEQYHREWFQQGVATWGEAFYRLQNAFFWPGTALVTLSPLVGAFGLAGMAYAYFKRRELRWLVYVAGIPAAYFTVRSVVICDFSPLARFTTGQVALLLPFVAYGFDAALKGFSARARQAWGALSILLALASPIALGAFTFKNDERLAEALRPISPTSTNPVELMRVASFMKNELAAAGHSVLLDEDEKYYDLQLAFFGDVPDERLVRYRWGNLEKRVKRVSPTHVVLITGGKLEEDPLVRLEGRRLTLAGAWYEELDGFGAPFRVFRRQ